ncbi:MAG: hypothetical protein JST01_24800 [Cyanobacteria bacterium SZAS TMP-1]|nr:hypothetical protein [Cyanobacteria bacterium SZAS TMP-1]
MTEHTVNRDNKPAATESPCTTEAPTTANPRYSLCSAVARHARFEKASFHTPGHKGRQESLFQDAFLSAAADLTELPGLDDLSSPTGVLADIERRAAALWGSDHSFISVNGASAALTAAILAAASASSPTAGRTCKYALMPRNAHRSAINALCLAQLQPLWYEPDFDQDWGIWGPTSNQSLHQALETALAGDLDIALCLVVSPTYAGAVSDIKTIVGLTRNHGIPLIVDEAHGGHFLPASQSFKLSAIACGADAVAHSWHKTLPALTQTGMLHLPAGSLLNPASVRSSLNMVTSTSPSYLLLASMAQTLNLLESPQGTALLKSFYSLTDSFRRQAAAIKTVEIYDTKYSTNPSHILLSAGSGEEHSRAHNLYEFLQDRGIFAEATMGKGVLFMLGLGSSEADVQLTINTIKDFVTACELNEKGEHFVNSAPAGNAQTFAKRQPSFEPILPPHQAMSMPHETIPASEALGRIAAQCLAPCPPGIPILIPGQKITEEVLELVSDKVLVVVAN